jgi:hypothetical protein
MRTIIYTILCLTIISCSTSEHEEKTIEINERKVFASNQKSELFSKISTPRQKFTINIKADTSIICIHGTVISIPKDCFVNKNGNIINDNVTIEVVEALTLSDFLRNDLQTVSGDKLLQSAGMIYIDASSENESLTFGEKKSLYVELPTNIKKPGFKVFNGTHDEQGNINWDENKPIDNDFIPLPLSELDLKYYTSYEFKDDRPLLYYLDSVSILDARYENTFVATEEFEQRLRALTPSNSNWWEGNETYLRNLNDKEAFQKYMVKRGSGTKFKITCEPIKIYLDHINKPLWYADSVVYSYLHNKSQIDSVKYVNSNLYREGQNHMWYYGEYHFKRFSENRLEYPKKFDPRGVDMNKQNAKELLIKNGYTSEEAYEQLLLFRTRRRILKRRQEERKIAKEKQEYHNRISKAYSTAFNVEKLGWTNVDQFFDDPNAEEVEFYVQTQSDSLDFCDLTLLLPNRSIAINGIPMGNGKYRFTKDDKQYRKLPIGEQAVVVAMSSKNGQPYFAMQVLKIEEKQNIEFTVSKSTWTEIEEALSKMN